MQRILPSASAWPLFDVATSRRLETAALAATKPHALMNKAGQAVARLALAVAPHASRVWIIAGPGNNGGDGLAAAIHLASARRNVQVMLLGDPTRLPPDARHAYDTVIAAGVVVHVGVEPGRWPTDALQAPDLAIDALLGIGADRAPEAAIAAAIRWLNAQPCAVLSVDVPTGLNADTGQPLGTDCVVARHTLSLLCLRPGLFTGAGRDHAGTVWLDNLGVDSRGEAPAAQLSASEPARVLPRRHSQNKGDFGDVIVVGGAPGMTGGALLAARSALAAGAGRVFVHLLQAAGTAPSVDLLRPELMFRGDELMADTAHLARTTVVCGCGGGAAAAAALPPLLAHAARLVLDADALNALARDAALAGLLVDRSRASRPTVLTPHPLEAARLLGLTTVDVQADRLRSATQLVERFGCTVVLKGSGSVIAGPGRRPCINASGNAALAAAGTGDVLAGWLGGGWAQAPGDGFDAAVQAVAEHGAAVDPEGADTPAPNTHLPDREDNNDRAVRAGDLIEALHRRQRR